MERLQKDPKFQNRVALKDFARARSVRASQASAAGLLHELEALGINVPSLSHLVSGERTFEKAIPTLLSWMWRADGDSVKEQIVRILSVPWASELAEGPLIDLYLSLDSTKNHSLKWAIGNALSIVSSARYSDRLFEIVQDTRHGTTRQMVVLSLANVPDERRECVLVELLQDPEVAGHAIMVLGTSGSEHAASCIERFLHHETAWIRREARRALSQIDKRRKTT